MGAALTAGQPDRSDHERVWSALHGGVVPSSRLVRGWLRFAYGTARVPARLGVPANAVTVAGLLVTVAAVPAAAAGERWPVLAAAAVGIGGVLDGLDGPVAVLQQAASRRGALLDSVADRLGEIALGAVLVVLGAPAWLVLTGVAAGWLLGYVRTRTADLGGEAVGVSIGERPVRQAVVGMFALAAGVYPGSAAAWATVGAVALAVTGLVGLGQVWAGAWRRLA